MAMGQNPVPPVKIPIPTKIGSGWCTCPKKVPLVLTHSQMDPTCEELSELDVLRAELAEKSALIQHLTQAGPWVLF